MGTGCLWALLLCRSKRGRPNAGLLPKNPWSVHKGGKKQKALVLFSLPSSFPSLTKEQLLQKLTLIIAWICPHLLRSVAIWKLTSSRTQNCGYLPTTTSKFRNSAQYPSHPVRRQVHFTVQAILQAKLAKKMVRQGWATLQERGHTPLAVPG